MKKQSNMGGGEFEFAPQKLEEKAFKRKCYEDNCYNAVDKIMNSYAKDYVDVGLGTKENFKEDIIRRLIKQFRGI